MVRLTPGSHLTAGYLAKSGSSCRGGEEVVSPGPASSPPLTDLELEASDGAGRAERVNPRVCVCLPPQLVFSEERHAGHIFPPLWSRHN